MDSKARGKETMNRRLALVILVGGLPAVHAADPLPSAESILDRYVEVTGGKQAYAKRKSEIITGTLEFAAQGIKGAIKRYSAEPDKYYATLDIPGIGLIEMGVSGGIAWEKSAIMGPRLKNGEEKAEAIREATLNSTLNWRKLYPKAETTGLETVNGEECYKVVMSPPEGHSQTMYFQKKNGLALKTTTVASSQMGEIPVSIIVSDYKNFEGVWVPAKVTQQSSGQEFIITIDSVEVNPEIPASRFALPAEVQALAAKAAAR
jgi:hypothetical protein